MKRRFLATTLALALSATVLAGCGTKQNQQIEPAKNSGQLEKTMVLYSPNQPELTNKMVNMFKEKTGVEIQVITGGTGELLKRVQSEKDNPQGDVFWAGGAESLEAYKQYFEAYATAEAKNIPAEYQGKGNFWSGFAALPMVIVYNKEMVPADKVPQGWADLLNPEWKGKISFTDPNKSGSSYTQMLTMYAAMGGWDYVQKFVAQLDGKAESSSTHVVKKVSDKELPIGITLEDNAYRYMINGSKVDIVYPKEGTSAVPDGMALIKGAKNVNAAKKFLDFLQSKEAQEVVAKDLQRRPVRTDVASPSGLKPLKDIKMVNYDFDMAANKKADNLAKWKEFFIK
ncbi:ABC transporter substrate-binding protein [Clostridium swellfunianum]|uniref:ABC transporter substrate-binding protein n=1 Tax=Clostridium swellfunianum TaxID=1367462 RepID=UPI0020306282|nr:ABC transporter substrate-binding protein [Clostridium swellfunianum]MCM0647057.1 ABC transporter substrate-binding protein [Clostridium swellfunianum]